MALLYHKNTIFLQFLHFFTIIYKKYGIIIEENKIGGVFMKKIVILIQNNALFFTYKQNHNIREDLMNTNIISDSELVFSDDYITENKKLVQPFIQELCEMNSIDTVIFQNNTLALFLIEFFETIKIRTIKIKKQENVRYELCEKLVKLKHLKELDCHSIPNFMLELLDKERIKVTTHSEIFYVSPFMLQNKLTDYSKMFYQKKIKISSKLTEEEKTDFQSFLKINKYLKVITLEEFLRTDLEFLLENLKLYHFKNVYIEILSNITKQEDFLYLKQLNKNYKKYKIEIGLVYTEEYIKENLMKQIFINTLRLCSIVLVLFLIGVVGFVALENYTSLQEVSTIQENVKKKMDQTEEIELPEEKKEDELLIKNKYIASLLSINPDVVGYLKVNNTNIDYPVVVSKDNMYYLKKNLYQEDDKNGWIFMDFRNSDKFLNDNTIIYGHNMYYSGIMFGTLHRALNSSWYNNEENLKISFDTMYESMNWQIYSIYTIPKTSDYLKVTFHTKEEKEEYINMTKNRSIKNFNIEVTEEDKLLTLSTCTGENDRLVIHAKLIKNTVPSEEDSLDNVPPQDLKE